MVTHIKPGMLGNSHRLGMEKTTEGHTGLLSSDMDLHVTRTFSAHKAMGGSQSDWKQSGFLGPHVGWEPRLCQEGMCLTRGGTHVYKEGTRVHKKGTADGDG